MHWSGSRNIQIPSQIGDRMNRIKFPNQDYFAVLFLWDKVPQSKTPPESFRWTLDIILKFSWTQEQGSRGTYLSPHFSKFLGKVSFFSLHSFWKRCPRRRWNRCTQSPWFRRQARELHYKDASNKSNSNYILCVLQKRKRLGQSTAVIYLIT